MPINIKKVTNSLDKEFNIFEPGQKLVGIDVGSKFVKIAILKETPIGTKLISIGLAEITPAEQADKDENLHLRADAAIKNAFAQTKLNLKKITTIFSAPSLTIKNISLPAMSEDELTESVKWELGQNIGFPVEEAIYDFLISGEKISTGTKNLELEVIAAKTEDIKHHMLTFSKYPVKITSINIPVFCLWNVFQKSNQFTDDETIALIDIGANLTLIGIFHNKIIRFTREIFFGGETITNNLVKGMNLPYAEAEKEKIKYGLNENSIFYEKIFETTKQLAAEIDRSIGYYKAQFHIERIDRVVLYGGTAKLINLDKFLSDELGLYVEASNPFNGLLFDQKLIPNLSEFDTLFAVAIGAAINSGSAKRINLLPVELRKDIKKQIKKLLYKAVPLAIIAGLVLGYLDIIAKEKRLTKLKIENEEIMNIWKMAEEENKRLDFLKSIPAQHENLYNTLAGIRDVIPEGVWLNSIVLDARAKKLVLKGTSSTNVLVIEFARKLESIPFFRNVKPESVEEKEDKEQANIYFKITIIYNKL